ncbi:MAG: cell division protein ZipA [Pseudomonadota bacterium]
MTDLLAILLIIAIVVVLLDGVRRKLRDRRGRVVLKLDRKNIPADNVDLDEIPLSELPNGGARRLERAGDEIPVIRRKPSVLPSIKKAREAGETPHSAVPVLMETVDLDEEDIEHTNVFADGSAVDSFVTEEFDEAETNFEDEEDDEDDEIIDGLDEEYAAEPQGRRRVTANDAIVDVEDLDNEFDDELEFEVEEQLVPEQLVVSPDEVNAPDILVDLDEDEDLDFDEDDDDEYEAVAVAPPQVKKAVLESIENEQLDDDNEEAFDEEFEDDDEDDFDEDEEDIDSDEELDDEFEDDYENEPLLLQDVYNKAAGHFKRPTEQQPRIEPGFGGAAFHDDELEEDFSSAFLDDPELNAELQEEMRPIPVVPRPVQKPEPEPKSAFKPEPKSPSRPEPKREPEPVKPARFSYTRPDSYEPPEAFEASDLDEPSDVYEPEWPTPAESWPPKTRVPVPAGALSKAPLKRESLKPVPNKKDQGELFREENLRKAAEAEQRAEPPGPQEVIIINVMARHGAMFSGADLLPVLSKQGLHLGEMSIFHRHAELDGSGQVMFSMANMVKPGTFNLAAMETFNTPGVSFFLQLPNKLGNLPSFEKMLAAASAVKITLDGEFKDENRSVFTRQTVEHCRQRIQDFELALLKRK